MINGSKLKTSPLEFYKTCGQKKFWQILSRDIVPTMEDWADTTKTKCLPWSRMREIELWTCPQKKKKLLSMPTTSVSRYLICSNNINTTLVEPNWMMRIPSACYICKSEIKLVKGMANWVTIGCFHFALCYECLDWIIWKLGLSPTTSCSGCNRHHECICTCHFGVLPSWVRREHISRKSP